MKERRVPLIWLILFACVAAVVVHKVANAGGDDLTQINKDGDVSISGGRAYGLSGGDMDINDCLATYSYVFGLWQDVKTNPLCVADTLDQAGKHYEAAQMRCSVRRVRKVYGSVDSCIAALEVDGEVIESPQLEALYSQAAQYAEDEDEDDRKIEYLEQQIEELQQQREEPAKVVVQKIDPAAEYWTAERRAKLKAALEDDHVAND